MMSGDTVLVIDDEPQIRRVVRNALKDEVARTLEAASGADGIDLAASARPELIVLDLGLPDIAGAAVCQEIRKWSTVPIVVLSARHSDEEKVALLDAGADDYVTKPFSTAELQARVRAQLRRARLTPLAGADEVIRVGNLAIDLATPSLTRAGQPVRLTRTEWDLLRVLLRHSGRTLTHRQIFDEVWGRCAGDAQQYVRVYVANLRRKLEPDPLRPALIVTESGVGYRFVRPTATSHPGEPASTAGAS